MQDQRRKTLGYVVFIGFMCVSLLARKPMPELVPFDFAALSSGFGNILVGLGGFSITVLAVLLGLEALDAGRPEEERSMAHMAAVRHVAISLAIASITCFVGASMMSEVSAQGAAIESEKVAIRAEIDDQLLAVGLSSQEVAAVHVRMLGKTLDTNPIREGILSATGGNSSPEQIVFLDRLPEIASVLNASMRRHFVLASVSGFAASLLVLQSLSFLLLIRFPHAERLISIQMFAVLGIGGMLFIKLMHTYSFGLEGWEFYGWRVLILATMPAIAIWYAPVLTRTALAMSEREVAKYTPLRPYYVVLAANIVSMLVLAATFNTFGPPTNLDRAVAGFGIAFTAAFLLVMQLEQPTIALLRREAVRS